MPRTSFLLPVYNGAATVGAALASVLAQTDPDFEVVVVDDGSTDATASVVAATADPRVRLIRTPHQGLVGALNTGLAACEGAFVARMDADDVAEPDRLALQLPLLAHATVVDGQVRFFRDHGDVEGGMRAYEAWINGVLTPDDFDRELLVESPIVHPAATFHAHAVRALGGYRDGPFPEDYDLWLRLHAAGHRLRKAPRVLVHMRDHPGRQTRTHPRYGEAAFDAVRRAWLDATVLSARRRVVLWGAGRPARSWLPWLLARHDVPAVIDVDPRKIGRTRHGVPVVDVDAIPPCDLLLVAVGARGARDLIRAELARVRPQWREGRDWLAVR